MLKEKAIYYKRKGYNCSQCILKASEDTYGIKLSEQVLKACSAVNNGFGIGNVCSVLIAGVMVFGLLFDSETAKQMRLNLFMKFHEKHSFDCMALRREFKTGNCEEIIKEIADIVETLIKENKDGL